MTSVFKIKKEFTDSLFVYKSSRGDNRPITIVSLSDQLGSWHIPDEEFPQFILKYIELTFDENVVFNFAEQHRKDGIDMLRIDIDLDGTSEELLETNRMYDDNIIQAIIMSFKQSIERYLNISYSGKRYYTILEEKENYTIRMTGSLKDGFHLYFPTVVVDKETRHKIFDTAQNLLVESGIFKTRLDKGTNIKQIVDSSVISKNGWMLYGSSKNVDRSPYKCTYKYILNKHKKEITKRIEMDADDPELAKQLVRSLCIHLRKQSEIVPHKSERIKQEILDWYGINFREEKEQIYQENIIFDNTFDDEIFAVRYNKIRELCECLSIPRLTIFEDWRRVGHLLWCLDRRFLPIWVEISRKIPEKFEEGACENMWYQGFKHRVYTEATLHFWAKEDNHNMYQEIMTNGLGAFFKTEYDDRTELMNVTEKSSFQNTLRMDDEPLARLVYIMVANEYICADKSNKSWYKFSKEDHRWLKIGEGIELRERFSNYVVPLIKEHEKENMAYTVNLQNRKNVCEGNLVLIKDDVVEDKQGQINIAINEELSRIKRTITSHKVYSNYVKNTRRALQCASTKDKIFSELSDKFYCGNFDSELKDSKTCLVCFKNGVFDLENKLFRDGEPEDYITQTMGCRYIPYDETKQETKDLNKFLAEVLVDEDVRIYFLETLSTALSGDQIIQKLPIAHGVGANGKSKIANLLEKTFGSYATTVQPELVTGTARRGNGQGATPETAKLQGKRLVTIKEIDNRSQFRMDIVKRLTGGDRISARDVYEKSKEFTPQFLILIITNHLPRVSDATDDAAWRRIREIPFKSRFKPLKEIEELNNRDPENSKYHFEMDNEIEKKLNKWIESFAGLLVKIYNDVKSRGFRIHEPNAVVEETRRYMIESDIYHEFMEEQLEESEKVTDCIELSRVFAEFKEWFKTDYPGDKLNVTKGDFVTYLRNTMPDDRSIHNQRLFGYRLKRRVDIEN